jgi:hypothetical protein
MVARTEQARYHNDRYWGGAVSLTLSAGATRKIHPEESRCYHVTVSGVGTATLTLPYNVSNWCVGGPYFTIWCAFGSVPVVIKDVAGTTIHTLAATRTVQLFLHGTDIVKGRWTPCEVTSGVRARLT